MSDRDPSDVQVHAKYLARQRLKKKNKELEKSSGGVDVIGTVSDRMRDELVPMFKEPWDARHPVADFLTGRRLGKSEYLCRLVLRGAWENPRSINPLILPTAKQARFALWPILVRTQRKHFPDIRVNESEMRMYMPEGGIVGCGGCEHSEDVVKWFGIPFEEAALDECGNFKNHLRDLFNDAIKPGTMDFRGRITRSGNPGIVLHGPWYEWTGPGRMSSIPLYHGDARLNPYIEKMSGMTPLEFFHEVLAENGWIWDPDDITRTTSTFVRLYLGKWAQDAGALVYPYRAYAKDGTPHNYAAELPTLSETGYPIDPSLWRYVLGMDIGFVDSTTYIILASHPSLREQYYVHAEGHDQWIDDRKIERIEQLQREYGFDRIVIDPGGGGKNVIATLVEGRPGHAPIAAESADKPQKAAAIRELRDGMLAGNVKFLPGAQPLVDEMSVLGWDDVKLQHDPNGVDHYCDAGLYAKRASAHYSFKPDMGRPQPAVGSNEWHEQRRQEMTSLLRAQGSGILSRRGRAGKVLIH